MRPACQGIAALERCRTSLGTDDQHRSFVDILRTICGLPGIISDHGPTQIGRGPSLAWMLPHCGPAALRSPTAPCRPTTPLRGRILARRSTLAGAENPLFIGLHCAGGVGLDRQFSNLVCTRRVPAEINFVWRVVVRVSAHAPGDIEDLGPRAGRRAAFTPRV